MYHTCTAAPPMPRAAAPRALPYTPHASAPPLATAFHLQVADQAIKALVPPPPKEKPPAEGAEGEPKEEESSAAAEKAKADQAAAAAEKVRVCVCACV